MNGYHMPNNYAIYALDESGGWRVIAYAQYLETAYAWTRGTDVEWGTDYHDIVTLAPQISAVVKKVNNVGKRS